MIIIPLDESTAKLVARHGDAWEIVTTQDEYRFGDFLKTNYCLESVKDDHRVWLSTDQFQFGSVLGANAKW